MSTARADRRDRHRLRRPGHGGGLRRAGLRGVVRRHRRGEGRRASQRGEVPIYEPGLAELVARHREPPALLDRRSAPRSSTRGCCSSPSARRRPTRATPTSRPSTRSSTRCRPSDRHALVMKSTVPVGTGASIKRAFAEQGKDGFRYVSCPEFLQEGSALADFLRARPRRGRRRRRLGRRRGRRALRAARRAARAHRHRERRDGQARLQRVPRHEDLLHQRDRQRLRGDRRRRRPRSRGGWAWTTASARSSCTPGIGFGGSCFPKDVSALKQLAGNSGYHFQLLNAVIEVNELQKRRVIGKLQQHLGALVGQDASRCSAWPSSRTPTTCARRPRSCSPRGCRPRARRCARTTRSPRSEARELLPGRRVLRLGAGRRGGRRRRRPRHRVAGVPRLDWAEVAERDARRRRRRRAQRARSAPPCAPAGLRPTRAIGRGPR